MPAKKKAVVNASATLPINDTGNQLTQQLTDVANLQLSEEEKKKRRGRKPKDKFAKTSCARMRMRRSSMLRA